ncbi:MAG: PIN domain-containing protein [Deltaproteobacteria bacterium]|nr:PIN domain-containing protein [Deltaproteobacteria bacterium]
MKVLFDTNIVLDVLLAREPHVKNAALLLNLVDQGKIDGVLSATSVTTIHYLATKAVGARKAKRYLKNILAMFSVAPVDGRVIDQALELGFPDFEDAVLHQAAVSAGCAAIVTRNRKDFMKASLSVFDPAELLAASDAAAFS